MDLFRNLTNIDFMGRRKLAVGLSVLLIIGAILSLATKGLNLGIDFTGGTIVEIGFSKPADLGVIRKRLADNGYNDAIVQHFGTSQEVLVRLAPRTEADSADISTRIMQALDLKPESIRRVEFVGPQIGDELAEDGGLAMIYALIGILIYVALRFEYRFAVGSVAALIHDVIITMGLVSYFGVEFNLTVLAAILAVIGYSLNDTIVVFDRIRENFRKMRKGTAVDIANASLNQTLSRTIMTSFTTLLVLFALFFVGGEVIHGFAFALIAGIVVGTYSSIYVASAVALALGVSKADLMPVKKEGSDADNRP